LIGRINRFRAEKGEGNPSLGTTNLFVISTNCEGSSELPSATIQAAAGIGNGSPARQTSEDSRIQGRFENRRSADHEEGMGPQYHC